MNTLKNQIIEALSNDTSLIIDKYFNFLKSYHPDVAKTAYAYNDVLTTSEFCINTYPGLGFVVDGQLIDEFNDIDIDLNKLNGFVKIESQPENKLNSFDNFPSGTLHSTTIELWGGYETLDFSGTRGNRLVLKYIDIQKIINIQKLYQLYIYSSNLDQAIKTINALPKNIKFTKDEFYFVQEYDDLKDTQRHNTGKQLAEYIDAAASRGLYSTLDLYTYKADWIPENADKKCIDLLYWPISDFSFLKTINANSCSILAMRPCMIPKDDLQSFPSGVVIYFCGYTVKMTKRYFKELLEYYKNAGFNVLNYQDTDIYIMK